MRRELSIVIAVVIMASGILWWRDLPLPSQDANPYSEPAYLLALTGHLAGPANQWVDLTLQKGNYFYPPGYFLLLASWIKVFGFSSDSLLGYTHVVHTLLVIALWVLLRWRYACSIIVTGLVTLSVFAAIPHGRPDGTAALLSALAWLALPGDGRAWPWTRVMASGGLAGATLLVSPAFGVGIIATLTALMLIGAPGPIRARCQSLLVWLVCAGVLFAGVISILLTVEHAWTLAFVQFTTNVAVRGREVNVLPDMRSPYALMFSVVPFLLLAVAPACVVAARWRRRDTLWAVSVAFLSGAMVWFVLNKAELLLLHHYLFVSKSVFLAVFCTRRQTPFWLKSGMLLLVVAISVYFFKSEFLYLATPLRAEARRYAATVQPSGTLAVDPLYFSQFYRPGHTLDYIGTTQLASWTRFLAAIPDRFRSDVLAGLPDAPAPPSMIVVSAMTVWTFGPPHFDDFQCDDRAAPIARLHALGRTWNLPAEPYAIQVCVPR